MDRYHRELLEVLRLVRQALHEIGEERNIGTQAAVECNAAVAKIDEFVDEFEE
jgi:hypothetical protein